MSRADESRLIGRGSELDTLVALLEKERVVKVVGPAGVGKTRLAAEVCKLAAGVRVADDVEPDVGDFDSRWIVTSRRRGASEVVFELSALSLDRRAGLSQAAQLYVARAERVVPTWDASGHEDAIEALVARLDGLPLAIEIAASRARTLGAQDLIERIDTALQLEGLRGRTFRAALDESWARIDGATRAAFIDLSVFAGPFDLDAAEAICGSTAAQSLEKLLDESLVCAQPRTGTQARFILYNLMRSYAREQADPVRRPIVVHKHAEHLAARATNPKIELRDDYEAVWLASLRDDVALELGIRCGLALESVEESEGTLGGRVALLGEICARTRGRPAMGRMHCDALTRRSLLRVRMQQIDGAREDATEAVRLANELGDDAVIVKAEDGLATVLRIGGRHDESESLYRAAAARAEPLEGPEFGRLALNFAGYLFERERAEESLSWFDAAQRRIERDGDRRALGVALTNLAVVQQELQNWDAAEAAYERAIELHRECGNTRFGAITSCDVGGLRLERGRPVGALLSLSGGIEQLQRLEERRHEGLARATRAAALALSGRVEDALAERRAAGIVLDPFAESVHAEAAGLFGGIVTTVMSKVSASDAAQMAREHAAAQPRARSSDEARLPRRVLQRLADILDDPTLVEIAPGGTAFRRGEDLVELDSRPVLVSLLDALITSRLLDGRAVSSADLIAAAWPGERIMEEAAGNRLRVALSTLRKFGLRDVLSRAEEGYKLVGAMVVRPLDQKTG